MSKNNSYKILALTPYPIDGPSSRYRIYQFIEPLANFGIKLTIHSIMDSKIYLSRVQGKKIRMSGYISLLYRIISRIFIVVFSRSDAIILNREYMPIMRQQFHWLLSKILRVPLIFDYDDAVFTEFPIDDLLRIATAVTPGNQFLADYAKSVNPNCQISIIPTVVDTNYYSPNLENQISKPIIIGWIGTESTFKRYFAPKLDFLLKIANRFDAVVHVVGPITIRDEVTKKGGIFLEWSLSTERDHMSAFHIGVMPLFDDLYSKGKCAFKLIEYGAFGIPSVASAVGANKDVVVQNETGFLVNTDSEWENALKRLLTDSNLRFSMGAKARDRIVLRYSLASQVPAWVQLIQTVISKSRISRFDK
jgi:glycosyltransferase involved in cell wall biosynthesis